MDINFFKTKNYNLFDQIPDAVVVVDKNSFKITYWNKKAKEYLGFINKNIVGKDASLILTSEIVEIIRNTQKNYNQIIALPVSDENKIYLEISALNEDDNDNIVLCLRNVSQRQEIFDNFIQEYKRLSKTDKNKNMFFTNVSNDIKSPLQSIIGFSQALLDGIGGELSEKQHKYLSIISKNSNNLLDLMTNIIDLSAIDVDKYNVDEKHFDVIEVLNSLLEVFNGKVTEKNLELEVEFIDIVRKNIYTDENIFRKLIVTLLSNAIKFTDSGSITFKVFHPDSEFLKYQCVNVPEGFSDNSFLMFSVIDTGIGIEENNLNIIFDEYANFEKNHLTKKHGGTGLSLSICRKLLEKLNGVIWVESEPGKGSSFNFIIPIEKQNEHEDFSIDNVDSSTSLAELQW